MLALTLNAKRFCPHRGDLSRICKAIAVVAGPSLGKQLWTGFWRVFRHASRRLDASLNVQRIAQHG
jgi:hypothetical protein